MTILMSIGIFLSVILFIEGGAYAYHAHLNPKTKALKRRLRGSVGSTPTRKTPEQVEVMRKRSSGDMPWIDRLLTKLPKLDSLEKTLQQANSSMPLGVFLFLSVGMAVTGLAIAALNNAPLYAMFIATIVGGFLPWLYMRRQRAQRFKDFQRQLPDALDLVSRSLRAGHAFSVGMKMVGDEFPDPIGPEFNRAVEEISFGIDVAEALKNLSTRIECVDLRFFITSLIVQRETGGNLAEILESISRLIRQRFELLGKVAALSAEGKLSGIVLVLLPFGIGILLWFLNPAYMNLLVTDPMGKNMLTISGVLMVIGSFMMKKMISFKV
ncbi:type II secretion system F family protein [Candidatus Nitronereus thalassa]|uniref:Type II secretion system F family protein n=1 Tax=Candidatus Nitronereus thalassa TaxID=3020898 RepID=A0ABU3K3Q4_9BACT|nr:type II secretion system F family protein [Candidatus Nitronereus thalassa]MDT7041006.1 type II secretion system F family protein [Candidatus Nitronereus thalassa]